MKRKLLLCCLSLLLLLSAFCIVSSADAAEPTVETYGYNLIFGNQVYLEYAVRVEGADLPADAEVGLLIWREGNPSRTPETADATLTSSTKRSVEGVDCYVFRYAELSAKEMTDKVFSQPYVTCGDQTSYGSIVEYSICTYAERKLGLAEGVAGTSNEVLRNMLREMLRYGAQAQTYFNYKTDTLATDILKGRISVVYENMENASNPNPATLDCTSGTYTLKTPTKEGYTFKYWADANNNWEPITEIDTTSAKAVKLSAQWELIQYSIIYKGTKGVFHENQTTYTVMDHVSLLPLEKYDYEFVGWRLTTGYAQWDAITEIPLGTTGTIELTAEWKLKEEFEGFDYVVDDNYNLPNGQKLCILLGVNTSNSMTKLVISDVFNYIQAGALKHCSQLEELTLPYLGSDYTCSTGSYLGYVFGAETALSQEDSIPQSLKKVTVNGSGRIGDNAFRDCTSLTDIVVSSTTWYIGQNAYLGCTSLVSLTTPVYIVDAMKYGSDKYPAYLMDFYYGIPGSFDRVNHGKRDYTEEYLEIPRYSFETLHINGGEIGSHAFYNNLGIKHLIIEGVEVIKDSAFQDAENMETLTLHEGLKQIEDRAFYSCGSKNFNEVIIPNSVTSLGGNDGGVYDINCDGTWYYDSVETTADRAGAFGRCFYLSKIVIGDGVEVIPYGCFERTGLNNIASPELELTLGKNVRVIGPYAFWGVTGVQNQTDCRISKLINNSVHKEWIVYTHSSSRTDIGTTTLLDAIHNCDNPPKKIYLGIEYIDGSDAMKESNALAWNGVTVEAALSYTKFEIVVYSYYNPYENDKAVEGLTYWHGTDPYFWKTKQYDTPVMWEKPTTSE